MATFEHRAALYGVRKEQFTEAQPIGSVLAELERRWQAEREQNGQRYLDGSFQDDHASRAEVKKLRLRWTQK